jgi:hypothetical protein
MADNIYGDIPLEFQPQMQDISQQQKLSQMLLQQGMQQPQGQMVSGHYVKPSILQNLNPLFSAYAGSKGMENAETKQLELAKAIRQIGGQESQKILELAKTDPNAALALASNAQTPQGKSFASALMANVLPKTPDAVAKYKFAQTPEGGNFKGSLADFENQMTPYQQAQLGIEKQKLGMEQQKLANELGGGKLTESQGNATAFGMRAKESNALLGQLEQSGTKNTGVVRSAVASTFGMTPFIGEKLEQGVHGVMNTLPSALGGPNAAQQATDQARRNFVTAVLRKESGAAISPSEFANEAQKYFPQPGDTDSVIRQKQHARETAIKALEIQAGPGANIIKQMPTPKLDVGGAKKVVNFNDLP